jgi:hypothetical protein
MQNSDQVSRIFNSKINVDGPEVVDGPEDKGAKPQAAPASPAIPPKAAAPKPSPLPGVQAARQPNIPAAKPKVGGFASGGRQAGIAEAMTKPAAPPPSVRAVMKPVEEEAGPTEEAMETEARGVDMPDELDKMFTDLGKA